MFKTLLNVFRIPELRNKLLFTIAMLMVYRVGYYVPIPGVNGEALSNSLKGAGGGGPLGQLANYLSVFSGGDLGRSTIFGLGIMPYISASIILQLLSTVLPNLEKLKKEGEPGMRKINEWTRYLSVGICIIQGGIWISHLLSSRTGNDTLVFPHVREYYALTFFVMGVTVLTAGSLFLMWLGEQIDHFGIGNGISLIITAGIVARMPDAFMMLINNTTLQVGGGGEAGKYGPGVTVFLLVSFVFIVAGSILLTQAQRRIRIQQAKHMRGRRVYGGTSQYLPLRVNHAGVMPIIFASSLMIFPSMFFSWLAGIFGSSRWAAFLANSFQAGEYLYEMIYIAMIFFFSYFWNTVQFNPKEISNQLRDYGSFIPGLRPGKRTADYLDAVMSRITYVGAAFLAVIAVIPTVVAKQLLHGGSQSYNITQFLGGTGLLIVISVMLDLINRIEANLIMRDYGGFLEESDGAGPGARAARKSGPAGPTRPKGIPS